MPLVVLEAETGQVQGVLVGAAGGLRVHLESLVQVREGDCFWRWHFWNRVEEVGACAPLLD